MNADRLFALYDRVADAPDAVGRLRQFVLNLAVRGKLVEQDPADEPASELLKRITSEKARLAKEGEFREPRRAVKISRLELPFSSPDHWGWVRLIEIAKISYGFAFKSSQFNTQKRGMPLIRIRDISKTDTEAYFEGDYDSSYVVRPGNYLVGMDGNFNLRRWKGKDGLLNQRVMRIDRWRCEVHPEFVRVPLQMVLNYLHGATSLSTVKHLSAKQVSGIEVPLPPLAEQRRIVTKVDELMALCNRLEEARTARKDTRDRLTKASYAQLAATDVDGSAFRRHARFAIHALPALTACADQVKHLRQTILSLAVRGKLVEQDPADEPASELLKRIDAARKLTPTQGRKTKRISIHSSLAETAFSPPAGWARTRLSKLVRVLNGRAYRKAELLDSGTPVLRVGNLFTSKHWYYSDLQLAEDKYCDEGDLLYAWSASFGPVIWQGPRVIFHYHIWKLSLFSETDLDKQFLYYFLLQQTQEIKSAGHGTSMVHMTKGKMELLSVPIPPLAEQHRIVAKVGALMALCDRLEDGLDSKDGTRNSLLESLLQDTLTPAAYEAVTAGAVGA